MVYKFLIFACFLISCAFADIDDSLVAWYKLEGSNPNTAYDSKGDADGDITGATFETGIIDDKALSLDGSGDYVSVDDLTALDDLTKGTICLWTRLDSDGDDEPVSFAITNNSSSTRTELIVEHDMRLNYDRMNIKLVVDDTYQWQMLSSNNFLDPYIGKWMHIAIRHDGNAPTFFVNGVEQTFTWGSQTDTTKWLKAILTDATTDADIQTFGVGLINGTIFSGSDFDGAIDDIKIYESVLTDSQIKSIWEDGTKRLHIAFNEGSGDTAYDGTGNGHDGYINGASWDANGIDDDALDFDGTNDLVCISTISDFADNTQGSISVWAKIDQDDGNQNEVLNFSNDGSSARTELMVDFDMRSNYDRVLVTLVKDGTYQWQMVGTSNVLDSYIGSWVHLVVVQDGTSPTFYINGTEGTFTWGSETDKTAWLKAILTDASTDSDVFTIGAFQNNGSDYAYFDGLIDEVRIYNSALTETEVDSLYNEFTP